MFLFFISYFLILKCQDLVLKFIYTSSKNWSCHPELEQKTSKKFLREDSWNFTKTVLWNQTFSSLFIACIAFIGSLFIVTLHYCSSFPHTGMMHTLGNKTLKGCFNTSQLVDKCFSFSQSLIWISFAHSKQRKLERKFWGISALRAHL